MSRIVAIREENIKFEGTVEYHFRDDRCGPFNVLENTNLVDGIGGVTWDGALILCQVLELISADMNNTHVVELGCGTGLCGIVAGKLGCKSTLTDRSADLAKLNVEMVSSQTQWTSETKINFPTDIRVYDMPWESSVATAGNRQTATDTDGDEPVVSVNTVLNLRGVVDLIVGAEITCLRKQQGLMVDTISQLTSNNPNAVVLLSFDGAPQPNGCLYEQDMIERMAAAGFSHDVVYVAGCVWVTDHYQQDSKAEKGSDAGNTLATQKVSRAYIIDRTLEYRSSKQRLHFPAGRDTCSPAHSAQEELRGAASQADVAHLPLLSSPAVSHSLPPQPSSAAERKPSRSRGASRTTTSEEGLHHIIAFYRPSTVRTCQRCHQQYFTHAGFNPQHACRHHSGLFVCRWHPSETKCSIDGHGDGLGYYGDGKEGYKAEFWDCCGSEDSGAIGCCSDPHLPY